MMLYPPIDELLEQVDSRFTLVQLATRRAHQLNNKAPQLINHAHSVKPVLIALEEIYAGKIKAKKQKKEAA